MSSLVGGSGRITVLSVMRFLMENGIMSYVEFRTVEANESFRLLIKLARCCTSSCANVNGQKMIAKKIFPTNRKGNVVIGCEHGSVGAMCLEIHACYFVPVPDAIRLCRTKAVSL